MKRLFGLSLAALLGLTTSTWACGFLCLNCGIHCICPPPACEDCGCACDSGCHRCSARKSENAQRLICELQNGSCCCDRISAAHKLGCHLHADFCCDPEVLTALIGAMQCDSCWEVRREAAWSIMKQKARTDEAVLALYVSSQLDPHYMVRSRAAESLDILTLCHKTCYKSLYASADVLIVQLRKFGYKPGSKDCMVLIQSWCAGLGLTPAAPVSAQAPLPAGTVTQGTAVMTEIAVK